MDYAALRFCNESRANGIRYFYVANYQAMKQVPGARHLRKGQIPCGEGKGVRVRAYGEDDLGNFVALCMDGHVRQFIN